MADPLPVMLACRHDDEAVIKALCRVGCECAIAGLGMQMCMSDDMGMVRDAVFAPVGQLVVEGHGWQGARLGEDREMEALLGGDGRQLTARVFMLGCCGGGTGEFTGVIARHLAVRRPEVSGRGSL